MSEWKRPKFTSLEDRYIKMLADIIIVSIDDLTDNEMSLIKASFELFKEKMDDLKIERDEVKRLNVELANLKSMLDDSTNDYDD